MTINPIAKKLGMKADMRVMIVAAPAGYAARLAPLPEGVTVANAVRGTHQFVQLFATHKSEIKKTMPILLQHVDPGALVWVTYPKKTSGMKSDLSRNEVRDAMSRLGWKAVTIVATDDAWSALRFRPFEEVGRR